jgi:TRAP-type C4-dicarboxylate transport system substrate-binding protein
MKSLNLKWVIAHKPVYLFQRVAEDFKNIVNSRGKDVKIDIEIMTAEEYNDKYAPETPVSPQNVWRLLQDNAVQITQMQTTSLARQANRQMHVLDMPFLFDDHDHAAEILEGEIGTRLLNNFDSDSRLKGLAYTYSGGFRLLPVTESVQSLAEIVGRNIRSGMSPIAQDTMQAFGFKPVPTEIEQVSAVVQSGQAVGAEYVAQRLLPDQCEDWVNTIINTEHSLFLTSIVVNVDWWNNLDQSIQQLFMEAALEAARNERALSLDDGDASLEALKSRGVRVIELDDSEQATLRQQAQSVYDKYADGFFEPGLVDSIKRH